jgi:hypothetical protein
MRDRDGVKWTGAMRATTDLRSDGHSRPVLSCGEPAISMMQSALFSSVAATATRAPWTSVAPHVPCKPRDASEDRGGCALLGRIHAAQRLQQTTQPSHLTSGGGVIWYWRDGWRVCEGVGGRLWGSAKGGGRCVWMGVYASMGGAEKGEKRNLE